MADRKGPNNRWKLINRLCIFDAGVARPVIKVDAALRVGWWSWRGSG